MKKEDHDHIDTLELEEFEEFDENNSSINYEIGYKGFNKDMTCIRKQYKIGEYASENDIKLCTKGIHYCLSPLHVFEYYPLPYSKICKIIAFKEKFKNLKGSSIFKKVTTKIKVLKELDIMEIFNDAKKYAYKIKKIKNNKFESPDQNGMTKIYRAYKFFINLMTTFGIIESNQCQNGIISNNGTNSIVLFNKGYKNLISTIDRTNCISILNDEKYSTVISRSICFLDHVILINGKSDNCLAINEKGSIDIKTDRKHINNIAFGNGQWVKVRGTKGNWIIMAEYNDDRKIINIKSAEIDGINIKENTYYTINNGKFVEYK